MPKKKNNNPQDPGFIQQWKEVDRRIHKHLSFWKQELEYTHDAYERYDNMRATSVCQDNLDINEYVTKRCKELLGPWHKAENMVKTYRKLKRNAGTLES